MKLKFVGFLDTAAGCCCFAWLVMELRLDGAACCFVAGVVLGSCFGSCLPMFASTSDLKWLVIWLMHCCM